MSRLSSTTLRIGDAVPPFSLPTLDGERYQLGDLLATGVGLLVFVPGGWSPGARQLVSELNELYEPLLDAGITLAMIFTQDASSLRRRMETRPPFPVLIDQERSVVRDFGVYRAVSWDGIGITRPAAFIVDHEGAIRFMYVGEHAGDIPDVPALLRLGSWLRGDIPLPERPVKDEADETLFFPLEATQVIPAIDDVADKDPEPVIALDETAADADGASDTHVDAEAPGAGEETDADVEHLAGVTTAQDSASDAEPTAAATADTEPTVDTSADASVSALAGENTSEPVALKPAPLAGDSGEDADAKATDVEAAPDLAQRPSPMQNGSSAHQEPGEIRRPTAMGTSSDR